MFHENSPISCAPTIRPLPFNVWNERRTEIKASEFARFPVHCGQESLDVGNLLLRLFDEDFDELRIRSLLVDLHD